MFILVINGNYYLKFNFLCISNIVFENKWHFSGTLWGFVKVQHTIHHTIDVMHKTYTICQTLSQTADLKLDALLNTFVFIIIELKTLIFVILAPLIYFMLLETCLFEEPLSCAERCAMKIEVAVIKDAGFNFIVRNLPWRIASYCNIISSKVLSSNHSNKNIKSSWLGKTDGSLKSNTVFANS